jgi:hypothetical protein
VADFGADATGKSDSTAGIQRCISAAKSQGKIVWIPAGTYIQSSLFRLNGVAMRGAGMWYTNLIGTVAGNTFTGNAGFSLSGTGAAVADLHIESTAHTSRAVQGGRAFTGYKCSKWAIENVWVTHTINGLWMSTASDGIVRNCRIRCVYADGINLNRGSSGNLVEHNDIRGCGDDGMAILSEKKNPIAAGNIFRGNTVIANWSGLNCDLAGGTGNIIEDNYLADNATNACFGINLPNSFPMNALTGAIVRRNMVVRGGGLTGRQKRGAVWIYSGSTTISGVDFSANEIRDSVFEAIDIAGWSNQEVRFEGNIVDNPADYGVLIEPWAVGFGAFSRTTYRNINPKCVLFRNQSMTYSATQKP